MKNRSFWLIGIILSLTLIFVISNPTTNDLKNYQKLSPKDKVAIERNDYFLFSIYRIDGSDGVDYYQYKYVGVLWTFFGRLTMIS